MDWTPVLVLGIMFYFIIILVKTVSDNKLRDKLVAKNLNEKSIQAFFQKPEELAASSTLKWGLVMTAVGLGFVLGEVVGGSREITMGFLFLFVGAALLVYYRIASRVVIKK